MSAVVVAAALAAGGITYAGFQAGSDDQAATLPADSKDGKGKPAERKVDEASAASLARKSGKPVEVTALRTIRSTTWARPDGLMTKKLYASPIWAKVGEEWKKIDTTLKRTGTGWSPAATNTGLVFSAGDTGTDRASRGQVHRISLVKNLKAEGEADSPLVTLTVGGTAEIPETHEIQLTWPGPVPAPVIDGSRALYPEILPGADLVLTAEDDGFAQLLVVKNRQAASDPRVAQLSYGLSSPTLTFTLDSTSGIVTAENLDGQEVALSPTPLMWDSSGAPAVTDGELGASSQPTASESPETPAATTSAPEPSPSTSTEELADDDIDPEAEVLPTATDEAAPTITDEPLPPVPAEPTPAPSHTGAAATLSLPLLNGPSPESHGEIVEAELGDGTWLLTPSQDFLNDPATVYPVFIDPTVKKHTQDWTTAYSRHPQSTFFNGKDFNPSGTHEARVGFESDTWGTSRSFFNIEYDKNLKGAKIRKATLRMLETYAWSCSARAMSVHVTSPINGNTNWKNAPPLTDSNLAAPPSSFAHGYNKSLCGDDYETFEVLSAAQKAADQGKSMITFGMRARNEGSQFSWKKFQADGDYAPYLELTYNRPPTAPTNLDLGPDFRCTTKPPYVRVGSSNLTFTASATDVDGNLDYLDFALWPTNKWSTTGDMLKSTGTVSVGSSTTAATRTTPGFSTDGLQTNTVYSWSVRAVDSAGSSSAYMPKVPCRFIWDETPPKAPKVTSTVFPNADGKDNDFGNEPEDSNWSKIKFGSTGAFTFQAFDSDVVRFEYGFNANDYPIPVLRTSNPITVSVKPPAAGPNVLYVRTVDQTGHVSPPTRYFFYVTPREDADLPGDVTGDKLPDLFTITGGNNLRLFPSQALKDSNPVKGTGRFDYSMSGAYQLNPYKDPNGGDGRPIFIAPPSAHFNGALITHNGDFYGGDGLDDLIVRVGGKLWMYPGDGYGAVNVTKRREILLPAGSPAPSSLTQILATNDITGDKLPDILATTSGGELWAFIGYTGASFSEARLITGGTWTGRDIVTVDDFNGDGTPDLLFRGTVADQGLMLRKGKPSGGGVDLDSLATAAGSLTGEDTTYGTGGWLEADMPHIIGTPDVNKDNIPDIWAVDANGTMHFYTGGRTAHGSRITATWVDWTGTHAFG
ncbi:FG-GAP-like repeat-containing protein [Streptomyces sp. NPDC053253]|uniref:FG-GAP-like repeat-containing protein n=1 Tax=Streptomyces sp. NPDC053253 TaxID=3365699 RepID=UPI0037CE02E2